MSEEVSREVDQLLKDRERYESWLQRLEAERDKATSHAYERVRSDYRNRLGEIVAQLRVHGQALQNRLGEIESRVAQLEAERESRRERLDEARLRRAVGEYTDDGEWRDLEGQLVDGLQRAEQGLEEARSEIGHLSEIVAQVGLDRTAATAAPPSAPASGTKANGPERGRADAPASPHAPEEHEPPRETTAAEGGEEERAPPAPGPAPEPAELELLDEMEPDAFEEGFLSLEELVLEDKDPEEAIHPARPPQRGQTPSTPSAGEAGPGEDVVQGEADQGGEPGEVGDELAFLESLSLGSSEEAESFSFLEQHGSGTPQTIICPHCSAANDPAEWYCTECGEELPAE